jgi:hypothetical protein
MSETRNPASQAYSRIAAETQEIHKNLLRLAAVTYRPNEPKGDFFRRPIVPVDLVNVMAMRAQWRVARGEAVPSVVMTVNRFSWNRHTGRVFVDADLDPENNTAAWECALTRTAQEHLRGPHLMRFDNRQAVVTAALLHRSMVAASVHEHSMLAEPQFPAFWAVFPPGDPPRMERTANTLMAVRMAYPDLEETPDEAIPDQLIREVFEAAQVKDEGRIRIPHWLLAREPGTAYATHPVDGTARPTGAATPYSRVGGWVMVDGDWTPAAQPPLTMVVDVSELLGYETVAAWEILVDMGMLPPMRHAEWAAATSDEEWAAFRDGALAGALAEGPDSPLVREWRLRTCLFADTPDEVAWSAFQDVRIPFAVPGRARVSVVRLQGLPGPATMSWRRYGCSMDLFTVSRRFRNFVGGLNPRDLDRLNRGLGVEGPIELPRRRRGRRGGRRHSRKSSGSA